MKRRHIAMILHLGNGHVFPALPLCSELSRRGWRVTCATSDHYAPRVADAGAEPVVYATLPIGQEWERRLQDIASLPPNDVMWWQTMAAYYPHSLEQVASTLSQVQGFYERELPDLVIYDRYAVAGRVLAKRLGCPSVQMSAHFASPGNYLVRENGVCRNPPAVVGMARYLDAFLAGHDITTANNLWHTEALNIVFIPREFQHNAAHFDGRFCFAGASLDRPYVPRWQDRSSGKPVVLVSDWSGVHHIQASGRSYFRTIVDALADTDCHCVLSIAGDVEPHGLGTLPANFEINQYASHLEILMHARLAICHGGMGSTLEALYHGVPVLAVPAHPYCEEIAYRVTELGVGVRLSRNTLAAGEVRDVAREMLEDASLSARVKELQRVFMQAGGVRMAADRIERFMEQA